MTVRDWWYHTAAIDILCKMTDNCKGDCVRRLIKPNEEGWPCPICSMTDKGLDCYKCMEALLNEEYEK